MTLRDMMPFTWNRETTPVRTSEEKRPMRRDPFEMFHKEFDEMFETFRREFGELAPLGAGPEGAWTPRVNVRETEKEFVIEAELPGMEEKDVTVTLESGYLVVRGERKDERKTEKEGWLRYESSYGRFERHVALPEYVKTEEPKATLKKGVLTVTLAKDMEMAKTQSQSIPVKAE